MHALDSFGQSWPTSAAAVSGLPRNERSAGFSRSACAQSTSGPADPAYPPSLVNRALAPHSASPQWPALALILSVTGVSQLTFSAVPPVLPELATALGVSRGAIGVVHGIVAVAGIFLSAYLGYLA